MRQEDEEGIAQFDPYGQAGFGVGQVLGRDAAKRQQEILTGSSYSANMPPPGYRPLAIQDMQTMQLFCRVYMVMGISAPECL